MNTVLKNMEAIFLAAVVMVVTTTAAVAAMPEKSNAPVDNNVHVVKVVGKRA
jgi:hypothetical protein